MSKTLILLKQTLKKSIFNAISTSMNSGLLPLCDIPDFNIEIPADRNHGDLSSNVAMSSARILKTSPRKIAQIIVSSLDTTNDFIEKVEIAGAGFINFFLSNKFFSEVLIEIEKSADKYGRSDYGNNKRVMIEFVSANPTGPMHMGNARIGAFGDCLAAVLEFAGYNVWREFYVNDAGNQIEKFAMSLDIRYQQLFRGENFIELPEDSYHGDDIKELVKKFSEKYSDSFLEMDELLRRKALVDFALPINILRMKKDMEKYRIIYDKWFHESELYQNGEVQDVIDIMVSKGFTYELDGALWYKATMFGADKDEVLIRSNGVPTYFAADIAYHKNKLETRNFDICIDILGADHHGHVARTKSAIADALNIDGKRLEILLVQLVRLVKNGEVVRMSKRTGKSVELSDLLDEVTADSARFIFNMYEANSRMDFDLDTAIRQDSQNPVYYVQYAYARICSIFKSLGENSVKYTLENLNILTSKEEHDLIFYMANFTDEILRAAHEYDPTKVTRYVIGLANLFHKFYNSKKVLCDDQDITQARLLLCNCVRIVIKNVLDMLKITAPDVM